MFEAKHVNELLLKSGDDLVFVPQLRLQRLSGLLLDPTQLVHQLVILQLMLCACLLNSHTVGCFQLLDLI